MCNLDVYPVKASKLPLARYPHRSLDGVDTNIVGYTREVFYDTLLYSFEKARALDPIGR
jgi:hypothetical protein